MIRTQVGLLSKYFFPMNLQVAAGSSLGSHPSLVFYSFNLEHLEVAEQQQRHLHTPPETIAALCFPHATSFLRSHSQTLPCSASFTRSPGAFFSLVPVTQRDFRHLRMDAPVKPPQTTTRGKVNALHPACEDANVHTFLFFLQVVSIPYSHGMVNLSKMTIL